jgi:hypothetical protein
VFTGFVHAEPERPRKIGCGHQKLLLPSFSWAPTTSGPPPATPADGSPPGTTEHQLGDVLSQHQTTPANSRNRLAPRDHRAPARGRSVTTSNNTRQLPQTARPPGPPSTSSAKFCHNIKQHPPTPADGSPPGTTEHQLGDVLSTTFGSSGALPQSGQRLHTTQEGTTPKEKPRRKSVISSSAAAERHHKQRIFMGNDAG